MDQSVEKGDSSVPDQFVEKGEVPIQCESDPYGNIVYDKETYLMPDQSVEKDHSSVPMEWESEPDGTIVYDEETYPMPDQSVEEDHSSVPIQCESDPYGLNGIIIYDKETYPMPDQSVKKEKMSVPIQCESDPYGNIVYDKETYPMPDQSVEEDHSSVPIQCESDPYGNIVYDKETYLMPARYRHNRAQRAFDDKSPVPQHGGTPAENYLSPNEPLNRQERCNQPLTHVSIDMGDATSTVPLSWWMNNQLKAGLMIMLLLLGIIIYVILGNMV